MRKILSMILAIVMVLSILPMSAFATEDVAAPTEVSNEVNEIPENYGTEVDLGNNFYYIEDGRLYYSSNNGKSRTIDYDVTWVVENNGNVYYSTIDGHNTSYIYKIGEETEISKIFCPVECFDVDGENVYYSYNGEITMIDTNDNCETHIGMFDKEAVAFLVNNGEIEFIKIKREEAGSEPVELQAVNEKTIKARIEELKTMLVGKCFTTTQNTCGNSQCNTCKNTNIVKSDWFTAKFGTGISTSQFAQYYYFANDYDYTVGGPTLGEWSCAGFASFAEWYIFKNSNTDSVKTEFVKVCSMSEVSKYAKIGDMLRIKWTKSTGGLSWHSGIYLGQNNSSSVYILDGNGGNVRCQVDVHDFYGSAVVITRAKNSGAQNNSISQGNTVKPEPSQPQPQPQPAADKNIYIDITKAPGDNFIAQRFNIEGTIKSSYPITWITAWLKNTTTGEQLGYYNQATSYQTKNYVLKDSAVDYAMPFSKCVTPGTYELAIGAANSAGVSGVYTYKYFTVVGGTLKQPQFSNSSIEEGQKVSITSPDSGNISYSLNGQYGGSGASISRSLKTPGVFNFSAWVTKDGYTQSPTKEYSVSVSKVATPIISDVKYGANNASVTISGSGDIYYTKNGKTPSKSSSTYTGTIYLDESTTIKAFATTYGKVNSDVATKYISVSAPDTPTGLKLENTKSKIAQGKTVTVKWDEMDRATGYEARLYYDGEAVGKPYTTKGTTASFKLDKVGEYTVKVKAKNFMGASKETEGVIVESMAPVTVTFVDRIIREGDITDEVVEQIQENINRHYKDSQNPEDHTKLIEGNVISVQEIDYDSKPSIPAWEDKTGLSRQYFDGEAYAAATEDKTVYAYYSVKSYSVQFWNYWRDYSENNEQIGPTQTVLYSFSAEPPTNVEAPTGYILAGWNVDGKVSDCYDFTFVDGNMKLETVYTWENIELPVILELVGAKRGNTCESYDITLKYINNNLKDTQARIIITLYTADNKVVYTATEDVDLMSRDAGIYYTETITANYADKVSRISAVMVQVKDEMTGGAISEMISTTDIEMPTAETYWGKWSDWSTTEPSSIPEYNENGVQGIERAVETRTEYRYRNKDYTSSASSSLSGWTKYNTRRTGWGGTQGPVYSNPSNGSRNVWSESYVTSSNYKNVYRYYRYTQYNSPCSTWGAAYSAYPYYYEFEYDQPLTLIPGNTYSYYQWCGCGVSGGYHTVYSVNYKGEAYPASKWVSYNYGTRWYYQEPIYTYDYWKWGSWSNWSDTKVSGDETQTRTVYRYRDKFNSYEGYDPSRDSQLEEETIKTYPMSGNILGLENDYNGKLATVLVYKKTNTDPTQEQLEYVEQITLGENNSYSFVINPKDEIDYNKTGDYIVTLSIEGCDKLANIDIIKAPIPQQIVTFQNYDGTVLKDSYGDDVVISVDHGGSIDVYNIPIPSKEGHTFVKWDKSLINIDADMTVAPIFAKNIYNVVYVDYENKITNMVEVQYGNPITLPEVEEIEGKVFNGWDIENYKYLEESKADMEIFTSRDEEPYYKTVDHNYVLVSQYDPEIDQIEDETLYYKYFSGSNAIVTESEVVTAKWDSLKYTVTFCDFDGNVVDDELGIQTIAYGESAQLPEMVEKDGELYAWDLTNEAWWNVTKDMIVYPYVPQTKFVAAPMISAPTDTTGTFQAELIKGDEEGKVFYTINEPISEKNARDFADMVSANEKNSPDDSSSQVQLMSIDMQNENENVVSTVSGPPTAIEMIQEYEEPITIWEGSIVYAFTVDSEGNISPISVFYYDNNQTDETNGANEYVPKNDEPQIVMATIDANPGETVTVPITIKNSQGLSRLHLMLGYNAEDIHLDNVENGDVFEDGAFTHETNEDGTCKFTWEESFDVKQDGTLLYLTFTVNEDATKDKYLLDLSVEYSGDSNEEEWYLVTVPGAIVRDKSILGDVNGDGEVDFADGIRILKHDVGLIDLTGDALVTGDVNGDGEVDFADAILVLKFDVGLISSFKK